MDYDISTKRYTRLGIVSFSGESNVVARTRDPLYEDGSCRSQQDLENIPTFYSLQTMNKITTRKTGSTRDAR